MLPARAWAGQRRLSVPGRERRLHPRTASGGDAAWQEPWLGADDKQVGAEVARDNDDHVTGIAGD